MSRANAEPAAKPKTITFHRLIPGARAPMRADRSAAGSLPTRAFRYCEPATSAAAFGWYVFPPTSLSLMWDGDDITWSFAGAGAWLPLQAGPVPRLPRTFRRRRTAGHPGVLAALPRRAAGTRIGADVDRPHPAHRPGMERRWSARRPISPATAATNCSKASSKPTAGSVP